MCVAVPSRIIEIEQDTAGVDVGGTQVRARLDLLPEAEVGDYVLIHAGFAITVVDESEALQTLTLMKEIGLL